MQTRQKPQTKRQIVQDARTAAVEGRWDETIKLNQEIIERFPQDAEAFNRLGRAHLAFGRLTAAHDSYVAALRIDPANLIARRNLQRLEVLRGRGEAEVAAAALPNIAMPRTNVFIEEVGKTLVEELINPTDPIILAEITPGEQLQIHDAGDGKRLIVTDKQGRVLGEIDAKFAERVIELQGGGNRYEIYSLGMSSQSLRIILREVYRDPAQASKVSFPGKIKATRAYLRERDLLRQRDEADFLLVDEDEEEEETVQEPSDDLDTADAEPEALIDEALTEDEEDQQI
jgi:tetratricopeptide (TPR) repeat protein